LGGTGHGWACILSFVVMQSTIPKEELLEYNSNYGNVEGIGVK
jgi:hypothetical protein